MDDIQTMLQDSANALFSDIVTAEALQRAESGEFLRDMWSAVAAQGFTLALRGEDTGGSAMTWEQVYPLLHAAGRYSLPLPMAETLLANALLDLAGCAETDGATVMTIASASGDTIAGKRDTAVISATLANLPFARHAQRIVIVADIQSIPHLGWVNVAGPGVAMGSSPTPDGLNIARETRDTVTLQAAPLYEWRPAARLGAGAVIRYGAMLRAAQMAGAIERILEQTVAYAGERSQFGRPLAKFQAIQHHIAQLGCEAGAVATAAAYAFAQADQGNADLAIAAAKIRAGRAAGQAAALAHAVHGAIGFTYEHSLQYATRRLWSWRSEYGSHGWWSRRLGQAVCAQGADAWWPIATSGELELKNTLEQVND